jgi:ABC-2 type transport system permease protein
VNRILAIAWKDLRSTMRNVPALAMMLAAPLALSALLGFAFGGGQSFSIAATKVAVANLDSVPVSSGPIAPPTPGGQTIVGILKSPQLKGILEVTDNATAAAARRAVDDGKAQVAVIIPKDFTSSVHGMSPSTSRASIELYENPTQGIGGSIVQSVVDQALLEFNGARAAAEAAAGVAAANGRLPDQAVQNALRRFVAQSGSAAVAVVQRPPELGGKKSKDVGVTGLVLAGMMVFFMFFGASNVARTIITEERAGTLSRLFTTPAPRQVILGGKFASTFLTVLAQAVIIIVAGRLFFAIDWGALDTVVLLILAAAAVASSLGLLVISLVRTPAQAGAIGAGVYLILALLGGNFTGTAQSGTAYALVQRFTPNGWLLVGWDRAMRGGGLADIAWPILVPLAFAVVFFVLAVFRFRRRFA